MEYLLLSYALTAVVIGLLVLASKNVHVRFSWQIKPPSKWAGAAVAGLIWPVVIWQIVRG